MQVFDAFEFADIDKKYLFTQPNQRIRLRFHDGEVECWWREAVLSIYCWKLHRKYRQIPLLSKYLIRLPINSASIDKMWNIVLENTEEERRALGIGVQELSRMIMLEINKLYNDSVMHLTKYITSSTARELRQIIHHPEMKSIVDGISPRHSSINRAYKEADELMRTHPDFRLNNFTRSLRLSLINKNQFLQVVTVRGYTNDIDYNQFRSPVLTGYGKGIHNILWSAQESRGASIAVLQGKEPVKRSDYLNRRLQLLTSVIRHIFPGDCGTKETIPWFIRNKSELKSVIGIYREDGQGGFVPIKKTDEDLIGKDINIRIAATCHKLHQYGVCETCLGKVAEFIPSDFSIGHTSVAGALQALIQKSLSSKHLIVSTEAAAFEIDAETATCLKFPKAENKNNLVIQPKLFNNPKVELIELIFNQKDLRFLSELNSNTPISSLQVSTASEIDICKLEIRTKNGIDDVRVLTVSDMGRKSYLTKQFLTYIFENQNLISLHKKSLRVDLRHWAYKEPIFAIPDRITGVENFMNAFEKIILNGCTKHNIDAQLPSGISDMIRLCYDIVHQCVDAPVAHLGVIVSALLIRDKRNLDYRLPLPGGKREFDTLANIYAFRSLSQSMAYERRLDYFKSAATFLSPIRPNHPLDALFFPGEMNIYEDTEKAEFRGDYPSYLLPHHKHYN